jgi:hypothetical protein
VLDSANLARPPLPTVPSAAIPAAIAAVPVAAIAALPAPPVALPAPPAGTPYQRLSNICNEHFLLKHTAKDKAGAVASGKYYGGTVTVISRNPTNVAALEAVVGRTRAIVLVTGWVVRNGQCGSSSGPMKVAVFGPAPFDHLDFST